MGPTPGEAKESPQLLGDAYEGGEADKEKAGAANKNGDAAEPLQEAKQRPDAAGESSLVDPVKADGEPEKKPRKKTKKR